MKMHYLSLFVVSIALSGCVSPQVSSSPSEARTESCQTVTEQEIASLFDRWNSSQLLITSHHSSMMPEKK